jgi:hypothetical protein
MKALAPIAAAASLAGLVAAAPAVAQYNPYPNQPGYDYPAYPGQSQGDAQAQRVIGGIVDALIGNRYDVSDRQAIRRCSFAAVRQAESQYAPYFRGQPYAYQGYGGHVRVTAITEVNRRRQGIRVKGLLNTARYGYGRSGRGADLSFRCDVDYRGNVYNVRLQGNGGFWRG